MIEIRYLQAESGANKFGTCNCCGKSSGEDPLMISIKFSYYGHGTLICLCDDCRKKLIEVLNGEQLPPANTSEIPNSSDTISRRQAIEALTEYGHGRAVYIGVDTAVGCIDQLPPAPPKTGKWILDRSGAYCCSECMEPCAGYVMMKPRDKFCKMCGSRNEVTE